MGPEKANLVSLRQATLSHKQVNSRVSPPGFLLKISNLQMCTGCKIFMGQSTTGHWPRNWDVVYFTRSLINKAVLTLNRSTLLACSSHSLRIRRTTNSKCDFKKLTSLKSRESCESLQRQHGQTVKRKMNNRSVFLQCIFVSLRNPRQCKNKPFIVLWSRPRQHCRNSLHFSQRKNLS